MACIQSDTILAKPLPFLLLTAESFATASIKVFIKMKKLKKVLFIAYYYPPLNRSGSRRPAAFAKYLPVYGWQPLVVTTNWRSSRYSDLDTLHEPVEKAVIGRTRNVSSDFNHPTIFTRMTSVLSGYRFPLPWTSEALKISSSYIKSNEISVILATYPPISNLYIADRLSRRFKIPWVADIRDIAGEHFSPHFLHHISSLRHIRWEKQFLNTSKSICFVAPGSLLNTLSIRLNRDISLIHNGFDPDFFYPASAKTENQFNFVYTGALGRTTNLSIISDSLSHLIKRGVVSPAKISLDFYGTAKHDVMKSFPHPALHQSIRVFPWSSITVTARAQREATVILHASYPGTDGIMTAKIYEYLAANRPILTCPGDDGAVSNLLKETQAGWVCSDVPTTMNIIQRLYQHWENSHFIEYHGIRSRIDQFSYTCLSKKLADFLTRSIET